ncbi:MAG: DUF5103 domain-containing protein [Bacteroidales bacterium]|jgi:hypothetical protein
MKKLLLPVLLLVSVLLKAQPDDYYSVTSLRTENRIYIPNLKTPLLYPVDDPLGLPMIPLAGDKQLLLQFDDLDGTYKPWQYTFIHCDALWNPSPLRPNEYLEGFTTDEIRDYAFSFNTTLSYTHYSLIIPNDYIRFTRSGNYLLVVYEETPEKPALTLRFMLYEERVKIGDLRIGRATMPAYMNNFQEVDFSVYPGNYRIVAPERDLKVVIMQNGRWENPLLLRKPRNIGADALSYDFEEENLFPAGNQYRQFDIKSLRYRTERVADIRYLSDGYHVYLQPDLPRVFRPFVSEPDINGRMYIHTEDMTKGETEADYAWVHFRVPFDYPLASGSLFILGALSGNTLNPTTRMAYNYEEKCYEATLLLKQGFYNYLYVFAGSGGDKGDPSVIEGNKWETPNEYLLLVYHREPGDITDKLIGWTLWGREASLRKP